MVLYALLNKNSKSDHLPLALYSNQDTSAAVGLVEVLSTNLLSNPFEIFCPFHCLRIGVMYWRSN